MKYRLAPAVFCVLSVAASACSANDASLVFGEDVDSCAPIVLRNDPDDERVVKDGVDCFMVEIEAGQPIVWDVLATTVEGDPVPMRYDFDGDVVVITTDQSRDSYGSGGVDQQRCDGVRRTGYLPEGVDCETSPGVGFKSDSLP